MPRKFVAVIAALMLTASLAACSTGSSAGTASGTTATAKNGLSLSQVKKAGELVVGTEGTYRPFSFHAGGSGALTGYDVDVARAVAKKLGVKATFRETQWDAIFAGLTAGRIDVIANEVSINPERKKTYDFSDPYTVSPGVLIVAESNTDITKFSDLAGHTAAQSLTSNWYKVAEDAGAKVQAVEGWAQAATLLRQGRVDATVNDKLTFLDYKKTEGDTGLKVVASSTDVSHNAFAFRKGSGTLIAAVNTALGQLRDDGTLATISKKYFGADVSE